MGLLSTKYTFDELAETVEEQIPLLLGFLIAFIFIIMIHRAGIRSRSFYIFMLCSLFVFDVITLGLTIDYWRALNYLLAWNEEEN